ncbi:hypothetical protein [Pseudomonas sp. BW7P1]|uniref:hypothetical protein n=1 Tax=Pseudomonas TaxID=286 RepID=UPI0021AE1AD1|nr:hypothetical protein [Pseudomonas sp. BW7P1]UWI60563.1 hypothetical protein NWV16_21015 [Pseudomonas sp. BW7P1]
MLKFLTVNERQQIADMTLNAQMDLPLASFDGVVGNRISFDRLGEGLTIRIPHFEGQRVGADLIVKVYGDFRETSWAKRLNLESDDSDTLILIPGSEAIRFRGQNLELDYLYDLQHPAPQAKYFAEDEIYIPVVDEAEQDVIPLPAVNGGINLRLRASASLSSEALVSVYMHGSDCDACLVKHFQLEGHDDSKDVVLRIEPRYLQPNKYGTVRFIYTVERAGRRWITPVIELKVEGDLKSPEPVYMTEGRVYADYLEHLDEDGRIPFLQSTKGMVEGDTLTFIFAGKTLGTSFILRQTLAPHQVGRDLKILVPFMHSELGYGGQVMTIVERITGETLGSTLRNFDTWLPKLRASAPAPDKPPASALSTS